MDFLSKYKVLCCSHLLGLMVLSSTIPAWAEAFESNTANNEETLFDYLKGQPTNDQLFLGMTTFHFTDTSRKKDQWNNKLVGFQIKDFFLCTFENSFYNQTWAIGAARNLTTKELSNNWDMTLGYRLGLVYGYKDGEAPFSSLSPLIPLAEIYNQYFFRKHLGVELMLTTSISASLFYQF